MKRRKPYRQRLPLPDLVIWTGVFVFLAFFGALYASVRNSQILTGSEAHTLENRLDQLRQDVANLELLREQFLEPAALERRLRRMNSELRPIEPDQLVTLALEPPADPLLALMLSDGESGDELPASKRGGWSLLPRTPVLELAQRRLEQAPGSRERLAGAGLMLEGVTSRTGTASRRTPSPVDQSAQKFPPP